jgi:hypothetical protein
VITDPMLVRILVRCYPRGWRARYGDEYASLLCDAFAATARTRRPLLVVNAVRGALDARVYSIGGAFVSVRSSLTDVIWAVALFTVAGIAFQRLTDDPAITAAADRHPGVGWSFTALVAGAVIALAAMVAMAMPAALTLLRGRRDRTWMFVTLPPVAFAVWYGVLRIGLAIADHHGVHSASEVAAAALVGVTGIGVVALTAWCASRVVGRTGNSSARLRRVATSATAIGMAAATFACLAWGLVIDAGEPSSAIARSGTLASPFVVNWVVVLALMASATVLAAAAARREFAHTGTANA